MSAYAFSRAPSQMAFISERLTQIESRGVFGLADGWNVPAALWCAPKGFDARYPQDGHATISIVLGGEPVERLDGRFSGKRGGAQPDLFMLYPGSGPRAYAARGWISLCHFYLRLDMLEAIATEESRQPGTGFELCDDRIFARDPGLRVLTDTYLARATDRSDPPSALEMDARAALLGVHVVRHHSNRPLRDGARIGGLSRLSLSRTLDFIDAHLDSNLSLADIAAVTGLSSHYFCVAFSRSVGMTPHRYMLARRIERAKVLLLGPSSLAEIALDCGFNSQSHFTSVFGRIVGVTPARWRRAHRSDDRRSGTI